MVFNYKTLPATEEVRLGLDVWIREHCVDNRNFRRTQSLPNVHAHVGTSHNGALGMVGEPADDDIFLVTEDINFIRMAGVDSASASDSGHFDSVIPWKMGAAGWELQLSNDPVLIVCIRA